MARFEALFHPFLPSVHLLTCKEVEDENDDEDENDLEKRRTGTKIHDCGYRLSQSDRSIVLASLQHARAFPYRYLLACFLPQSSFVLVLVLDLWSKPWH